MSDNGHGVGSAIGAAFAAAQSEARCALVTYLTAGYPSMTRTPDLLHALQEGGVDIIELGVPYSDPVADGPTIQHAGQIALQGGATPRGCIELVAQAREEGLRVLPVCPFVQAWMGRQPDPGRSAWPSRHLLEAVMPSDNTVGGRGVGRSRRHRRAWGGLSPSRAHPVLHLGT